MEYGQLQSVSGQYIFHDKLEVSYTFVGSQEKTLPEVEIKAVYPKSKQNKLIRSTINICSSIINYIYNMHQNDILLFALGLSLSFILSKWIASVHLDERLLLL